jgi:hypothetical protein
MQTSYENEIILPPQSGQCYEPAQTKVISPCTLPRRSLPSCFHTLQTMTSAEDPPNIDKGKGRDYSVDPSERTPLLGSQSHTSHDESDLQTTSRSRRRLWSKLTFVFLVTLSICRLSNVCRRLC